MARKLVLFDLDWTLVYTGGAGVRALDSAFEALFDVAHAMKTVSPDGKTDPAICREMIRVHLGREPQAGEIEDLLRGYLDRLEVEIPTSPGYRVLPGVQELLEGLSRRADVLMGLGTGNLEEGARIKLARAGLMKYFRFGGYGSDSEDRPTVLRKAVERGQTLAGHPVSPGEVIVVGDNIRDIQAGQAIGAVTVAVASGPMTYDDLARARPDHLFGDLLDRKRFFSVLNFPNGND
jgi:phosphoglycolate phosphatase